MSRSGPALRAAQPDDVRAARFPPPFAGPGPGEDLLGFGAASAPPCPGAVQGACAEDPTRKDYKSESNEASRFLALEDEKQTWKTEKAKWHHINSSLNQLLF